ncbi:T9SS type B sorting domain-containing protein [Flavobacterium enshiense]|uniref:T9SS type B sorting domain-containing protein n=1 Tax=Flavobacterium enshiense TaxID=1341165 RepID=UPI00345D88B3
MRKSLLFCVILSSFLKVYAQKENSTVLKKTSEKEHFVHKKIEDTHGHTITDPVQRAYFLKKREQEHLLNSTHPVSNKNSLSAVHLCSNNNFEEYENQSGNNVLKHFLYKTTELSNPTQCVSQNITANQYILQYNPSQTSLMSTTVPSNHIDEFIGDIGGFDQFALKINYKESSTTSSVVQAKRFKTNNENEVVFNYKTVLQSIEDSGHEGEQPFFKARIIRSNGWVVNEFCVIGDPTNCIFTQAPNYEAGSIILYTQNWQTGSLDISSIPNNEEFTIEFTAARCGLGAHFGYAYVDDLCLKHSDENLQGSIELDPLFKICPTLPISVCGNFTVPNSGGVSANIDSITLNVFDQNNALIYSTSNTSSLDLNSKTFCFELNATNLPNTTNGNYNVSVSINYGLLQTDCTGTNFNSATDNDANPGWDISFMNCTDTCNFILQSGILKLCDTNDDGKEFFNLTDVNPQLINTQNGLSVSYFTSLTNATNNTNPITTINNYESYTTTLYARVYSDSDATCFKVIAFGLVVKNPSATISGILNVCGGSTVLTASPGASYLWSNGATSQSVTVTNNGTYTVMVTDSEGCISDASVTIIPSNVAVSPTINVTQPTCSVHTGTIEVTSPAAEYSFDGGTTWTTNPILTNAPVGNYSVKIKTVNGCLSYNSPISLISFQSSYPYYTSVKPTNCEGTGSITITTVASEYSFDDGLTWTTNNTANNLPIGTYLIRTKDNLGCISDFNSVVLSGEFLADPTYTTVAPYCSNPGSITITTQADHYSFDGGTTWQTSNTLNNLTADTYIIKIKTSQGCTSGNVYVYLTNFQNSYPTYTIDEAGCDRYATLTITTPGDYYSFDGGTTWTTNNSLSNLNGGTTYQIRVKKNPNCVTYTSSVRINSYYLPLPTLTDYVTLICDNQNNGNENVNLTNFNSNFISNSNNHTFKYYHSLNGAQNNIPSDLITNVANYNLNETQKTFFVLVTDSNGCSSIAYLDLTLIATPEPSIRDFYYLCENSFVKIEEQLSFDSYSWSNGTATASAIFTQPGTHSLTVTENHGHVICSTTKSFEIILSNPATITQVHIDDWTVHNNSIQIIVSGLGDYEYSLDGIQYQNSNVFNNMEHGEHNIFVRDKNGCGITVNDVYLLIHPTFFTPNGDGYNDYWKIRFSEEESDLIVHIYDRYGKLLKQIGSDSKGWDGTYLGVPLPQDDYWFVVKRQNGKEYKGHFSLKR